MYFYNQWLLKKIVVNIFHIVIEKKKIYCYKCSHFQRYFTQLLFLWQAPYLFPDHRMSLKIPPVIILFILVIIQKYFWMQDHLPGKQNIRFVFKSLSSTTILNRASVYCDIFFSGLTVNPRLPICAFYNRCINRCKRLFIIHFSVFILKSNAERDALKSVCMYSGCG